MDELTLVREFRAAVAPPSDAARARAVDAWSGTAALSNRARRAPSRRSHRFGVRVLIAVCVLGVTMAGFVLVVNRALDDRIARVPRVSLPAGALQPVADGHYPQNFLVIGTDAKGPEESPRTGPRSDVMILIRVKRHSAMAIWFPRDLEVQIPGYGPQRMNAAYSLGGVALAVETLEANFHLPVNHFVELRMTAFPPLVDALGGVRLSFPEQLRDSSSGLDVPAGCSRLDGEQVLAVARSRSAEALRDGRWQLVDVNADLSRAARQQQLLATVAASARQRVHNHPTSFVRITDALLEHVRIDSELSRTQVLLFGRALLSFGGSKLTLSTLPVAVTPGGVVTLSPAAGADQVVDGLGGNATASDVPPVAIDPSVYPSPC